jgi:hypothetical protein
MEMTVERAAHPDNIGTSIRAEDALKPAFLDADLDGSGASP